MKSSWNKYTENYHPNYVLDNNPKTAWVEGVEGNGEYERIVIPVSSIDKVAQVQLRIRNGYQKSRGLLRANGAPKDVTITVLTRNGAKVSEMKSTLKKSMGWQTVDISIDDANASIGLVQLSIDSVHTGTKYKDTCISDIEVLVDSESPYKKKVEEYKRQQLQSWVKERRNDAQFFANKPKEYPFLTVQFDKKVHDVDDAIFAAEYEKLTSTPQGITWDSAYYTRENKSPIQVLPDFLYYLPKDIWRLSDLALFETKNRFAKKEIQEEVDTDKEYIPGRKHLLGNFRRAIDKDGVVKILSFQTQSEDCERQCYSVHEKATIHYFKDAVSKLVIEKDIKDDGPEGNSRDIRMYSFRHNDGKIDGWTYYHKQYYQDWPEGSSGEGEPKTFSNVSAFDYTSVEKE